MPRLEPKLEIFFVVTRPWIECEICTIGLFWLDQGDYVSFGLSFFFIELAVAVYKRRGER